jgi:hypothetical protein
MMGLFDKVNPETVREHARRMWETKLRDKYPYHAESPVGISPTALPEVPYGRFGAVVMKEGVRTWGFETEFARDRFVAEFNLARKI